jgi:glycosyltransferase involved in cell wall biosynthesis
VALPVLDVRPLQEAHALRGVGTYVSALMGAMPFAESLVWAGLPVPAAAEVTTPRSVPGSPQGGRFGWCRDAVRSARTGLPAPLHVPVLDVRLTPRAVQILTVHDAIPWRFPHLYPAGRVGAIRRRLDVAAARRADVVITISEASAADAVDLLGVPAERIRIVAHCVGPGWPTPQPGAGRARPEAARSGRRYVVAAGGFRDRDPRKRLPDLLEVLRRLPPEIGLVVTGSHGPQVQPFLDLAGQLGVEQRVELPGQLPLADLVELFAGAAAFAFPSAWEGFGLPLLEAMSVGLPSVVADGGALREVAGNGATVVPVGDVEAMGAALGELLDDGARAAAISRLATARAATFTQERFVAGHEAAYR